ncbi:MAG: hypothetical protein IPG61_01725 [bacterium]|nr:hypothetical protein [bacterium]
MLRETGIRNLRLTAVTMLMMLAAGAALAAGANAPADEVAAGRAAWLLQRGSLQDLPLTGRLAQSDEFGSSGGGATPAATDFDDDRGGSALPVLASLVLPGAGEAMLGHKRGYLMMALDIFAWTQVAKKHGDGNDLRDEYYAFADEHYSDELLLAAYVAGGSNVDSFYRADIGTDYFDFEAMSTLDDLDNLPLYVTVEEDRREYYENLGKWDQFVFGWDDFMRPDDYASLPGNEGYEPTGDPKIDFANPWVSENRESYRLMRDASNDAFKSRDRWLYVNIGLRIFSVLQTAWLDGLLGGDGGGEGDTKLSVNGHEVRLIAQPTGLRRATVAATVSF